MIRSACAAVALLGVALTVSTALGAADAVTSQGMIIRDRDASLRVSPLGTARIEVELAAGVGGRIEAAIVAATEDGVESSLGVVPGTAFFVSDVGRIVAIEPSETRAIPGVIRVLDLDGREAAAVRAPGLTDPALSSDGASLVYGTADAVTVMDLTTLEATTHPRFAVFAAGPGGLVAGSIVEGRPSAPGTPRPYRLTILEGTARVAAVPLGARPERVVFTADRSSVLVLTAGALTRIAADGTAVEVLFEAPAGARLRDLSLADGAILVGFRTVETDRATGWLASISDDGRLISIERGPSRTIPRDPDRPRTSRGIPWPIAPDLQHPVGNTYGEYQNYGTGGYLHPGVDVMGSPNQAVYAVRGGVVKAVMTTGAEFHWRVAVADSATTGISEGYLYAHLDQFSIAVSVGEVVAPGQYLGDLVEWPIYGFTHVHFARVEDEGIQWYGQWLSTENPHLDFENQSELAAPVFEPARGSDLLAFCANQTSIYRDPSSLSGVVDIIAHVGDLIESSWVCTVQEIRYTIYPAGYPEFPVVDDKLALFCDMALDTYFGGPIDPFLVSLLYKRDGTCFTQGDYDFREFYHVITNSDGDQIYEESDLWEAWDTTALPDADYVIRVVATDVAGNATADSMIVTTANGNSASTPESEASGLALHHCRPNPSRGGTAITFTVPARSRVRVSIHDPAGRLVRRVADESYDPGRHALEWDGRDSRGSEAAAGVYLVRLETPVGTREGKLIVIR
jgi:murein DD-endopeptidase MepM/ murein hydrolase activator NlpD